MSIDWNSTKFIKLNVGGQPFDEAAKVLKPLQLLINRSIEDSTLTNPSFDPLNERIPISGNGRLFEYILGFLRGRGGFIDTLNDTDRVQLKEEAEAFGLNDLSTRLTKGLTLSQLLHSAAQITFDFTFEELSRSANNINTKMINLAKAHAHKWDDFLTHLNKFENIIKKKFANQSFEPIPPQVFDPDTLYIKSHQQLVTNMQIILKFVLGEILKKSGQKRSFTDCPNKDSTRSDIYVTSKDQIPSDIPLIEVETTSSLEEGNLFDKLQSEKHMKALGQVYGQLKSLEKLYDDVECHFIILSSHAESTVFVQVTNEDILFVGPTVKKEKFIEITYFVLSLMAQPLAEELKDWRDEVLLSIKDQAAMHRKSNKSSCSCLPSTSTPNHVNFDQHSHPSNHQTLDNGVVLNESNGSGVGLDSLNEYEPKPLPNPHHCLFESLEEDDILKSRNWTEIAYGACGHVCRTRISKGDQFLDIAIKQCHISKATLSALQEIHNESNILKMMNDLNVKFVPKLRFSGQVYNRIILAIDFINGKVFDDFKQMPEETVKACVIRVAEFHKLGFLHGDLRAPNFIVDIDNNVYLIDFGRSRFLQNDPQRYNLLEEEMKSFKSVLKSDI